MARLKLIEYLNNPNLLDTISEEEMIAWAKEVPYAGLVQKLLAQKLAIQSARKDLSDEATTMAILSNANPNQVISSIEDFKNLMLKKTMLSHPPQNEEHEALSNTLNNGHGKSDVANPLVEKVSPTPYDVSTPAKGQFTSDVSISSDSLDVQEDKQKPVLEEKHHLILDNAESKSKEASIHDIKGSEINEPEELSEFANWLISLQSIDQEEVKEEDSIMLKDKKLASTALVEVLVSQGHYIEAIAMYEILMLKNPQKSSFFAAQIQKLKAL